MTGFFELADGRRIDVTDGLTIGRVDGNDVVLHDGKVSRKHARVIAAVGVVEIEDLGSSNGTLLNGKRVQRRLIRDGDVVRIGTTDLVYRAAVASPAPPAPAASPAPSAAPTPGEDLLADDDVIEFEDEVVAVAPPPPPSPPPPTKTAAPRPAPPPPPDTATERGPTAAMADDFVQVRPREVKSAPSGPSGARTGRVPQTGHGVLQFHRRAEDTGVLTDDLGQLSGLPKLGLILLAIAVAVGLGYLAMRLAAG